MLLNLVLKLLCKILKLLNHKMNLMKLFLCYPFMVLLDTHDVCSDCCHWLAVTPCQMYVFGGMTLEDEVGDLWILTPECESLVKPYSMCFSLKN